MTSSLPKVPLCPRAGRAGQQRAPRPDRRAARDQSPAASRSRPAAAAASSAAASPARARRRSIRRSRAASRSSRRRVDVRREDVAAAGRADAEGDRQGVLALVGDGDRDRAPRPSWSARAAARPWRRDRRLAGRQSLDLDVAPADAAHAEAQHLADGLLGRPAARRTSPAGRARSAPRPGSGRARRSGRRSARAPRGSASTRMMSRPSSAVPGRDRAWLASIGRPTRP